MQLKRVLNFEDKRISRTVSFVDVVTVNFVMFFVGDLLEPEMAHLICQIIAFQKTCHKSFRIQKQNVLFKVLY